MILQHAAARRRRRRIPVLAAGAALAAPAAVLTTPAPAAAAPAAAAPDLRDFDLRRGPALGAPLRALDAELHRGGAVAVLGSSGQHRLGGGCGAPAAVPAGSRVLCFDDTDFSTRQWVPQGVTSASDALRNERWAGARPLLVSWHDKSGGKVRVTFVDPDRGGYRHVLLVHPEMRDGRPTYGDIAVHAGGIAWYGNKLYVADTRHGVREFDMRRIYDLGRSSSGSTADPGRVGLHGGTFHAHGHRFVMPQTGSWQHARGTVGAGCAGTGALRMSWIGVDRTSSRHALIAGEWCRPDGPRGRLVTWPLQALSGGGTVRADWAAALPAERIQGAARTNGRWWFTQGAGDQRGRLLTTRHGLLGWGPVTESTISHGPEDLSCYRAQRRIWTVAEYAGKRALWGFPANSCH